MHVFLSLLFFLLISFSCRAQDFWQITNGPQDGDVMALAMDSAGTIYAITMRSPSHPFFRSTDGGNRWERRKSPGPATAIAVNSQGHCYVVYKTPSIDTLKDGIWRSTNGGETWDSVLLGSSRGRAIVIAPNGGIFFANDRSLRHSADNGASWNDIRIRKDSAAHLANQVQELAIGPAGEIVAATLAGIYRSDDNGLSWVSPGSGAAQLKALTLGLASDVIFAGTDSSLFRSTDGGVTWTKTSVAGKSPISILIHPGGDVFAGVFGSSIYRSTDRGIGWTETKVKGLVVRSLLINQQGDLFASSGLHGVYRSTDNGTNWRNSSTGMNSSTIDAIAVSPNGKLFVGIYGHYSGFIYSTTDRGDSWQGIRPDSVPKGVWCMAALSNGYVLAGTEGTGIYRSTDDGETWQTRNSGLKNLFIRSFAIKPNGDILAGTESGLYISSDQGATWRSTSLSFGQVWSLAVHPDGTIVAGLANGGLYYSQDDGVSWKMSSSNVDTDIQALAVGRDGAIYAAVFNNGVLRSTDTAKSWTKILDEKAYNMALLVGRHGEIYLGGNRGVRYSTNNGQTWDSLYSGMGRDFINAFGIDSMGYIYAGTSGQGLARSNQRVAAGIRPLTTAASSAIKLEQNIPNPVLSTTAITFTIEYAGFVRLSLHDLLGSEVARPVDHLISPGEHTIKLDCRGWRPGTYYYELQVGNRSVVRKLVVGP